MHIVHKIRDVKNRKERDTKGELGKVTRYSSGTLTVLAKRNERICSNGRVRL